MMFVVMSKLAKIQQNLKCTANQRVKIKWP